MKKIKFALLGILFLASLISLHYQIDHVDIVRASSFTPSGSGGGTASPAGVTGQLQVNSGGSLGAVATGTIGEYLGAVSSTSYLFSNPVFSQTFGPLGQNYPATGTNDQVGANNAFNAATALANGGSVFAAAGTYNIASDTILSMKSNTALLCDQGAYFYAPASSSPQIGIFLNNSANAYIQGCNIDGSKMSNNALNSNGAVEFRNTTNANINNTNIINNNGFGAYIYSGSTGTSTLTRLENNTFGCTAKQDCIGGGTGNSNGVSFQNRVLVTGNQITQTTFAGGLIGSTMDPNCFDMTGVTQLAFEDNDCFGQVFLGNEQYPNTNSSLIGNIMNPPLGAANIVAAQMLLIQDGNGTAATNTPDLFLMNENNINQGNIYVKGTSNNPIQQLNIQNDVILTATSTAQKINAASMHGINITSINNSIVSGDNIMCFPNAVNLDGIKLASATSTVLAFNSIANCPTGVDLGNGAGNKSIFNNIEGATSNVINGTNIIGMDDNGQVYIGTSTAVGTLTIQGQVNSAPLMIASSSGANILEVYPNGSVGISNNVVNTPAALLTLTSNLTSNYDPLAGGVANNSAYPLLLQNFNGTNGSSTGIGFVVTNSGTVGGAIVFKRTGSSSAGELQFYTKNASIAENMVLSSAGQLGIGTTTPDSSLDVYGNFRLESASSTIITASISGAIVGLGCDSATSSVDSSIASSTTAFITTPQNYPGDGLNWFTYLSATGVITTKVCSDVTVTPAASKYVVKIIR